MEIDVRWDSDRAEVGSGVETGNGATRRFDKYLPVQASCHDECKITADRADARTTTRGRDELRAARVELERINGSSVTVFCSCSSGLMIVAIVIGRRAIEFGLVEDDAGNLRVHRRQPLHSSLRHLTAGAGSDDENH